MGFLGIVGGFQNLKAGTPIEFDAFTVFIFWVIGFGPLVLAVLGILALMAHLYKKRTGHSFFKFQREESLGWRSAALALTRLLAVVMLIYLASKFFPVFWSKPLFILIFTTLLAAVALFMFIKNKQHTIVSEKKPYSNLHLGRFFVILMVIIGLLLLYYHWVPFSVIPFF